MAEASACPLGVRGRRARLSPAPCGRGCLCAGPWHDAGRGDDLRRKTVRNCMCYSAMIWADYRRYVREWGADIDIKRFVELFWWKWSPDEIRRRRSKPNIPKSLAQAFADPQTDDERTIKRYIDEANQRQELEWQQELFAQRARLVKAEQKLAVKYTKGAAEDQRIATDKIGRIKGWLEGLMRTVTQ